MEVSLHSSPNDSPCLHVSLFLFARKRRSRWMDVIYLNYSRRHEKRVDTYNTHLACNQYNAEYVTFQEIVLLREYLSKLSTRRCLLASRMNKKDPRENEWRLFIASSCRDYAQQHSVLRHIISKFSFFPSLRMYHIIFCRKSTLDVKRRSSFYADSSDCHERKRYREKWKKRRRRNPLLLLNMKLRNNEF